MGPAFGRPEDRLRPVPMAQWVPAFAGKTTMRRPSTSLNSSEMAVPDRLRGFFASRRAVAAVALVCIALMLVSVNIIAAHLFAWRLDLTGEHLYTLSRGTERPLARIDEPITLRFYYSTRLADE